MVIREDIKQQVQQATDIVRLIGEQIALRPRGKEFVGLCPFHDDKKPSLNVSGAKQIYKCFACGAGGDAFGFVMSYHKMTFPEAIRHLAERAGVELKQPALGDPASAERGPGQRQLIGAANGQALAFYRAMLKHSEHGRTAREYIDQRGIRPETANEFQLGYAPDRWDGLAVMIRDKGWNRAAFEAAGLIAPRVGGDGYFDRLRHRLVFPIFDAIGRPIAFGGRALPGGRIEDKADAKYLNSPETMLFDKSATLYGLHLARKPIIDSRVAVVVEGYTDVIACHQAGVRNIVATLGTALTADHVRELRRYVEKVVLIFDPDEAGQSAADRAVELFLNGELDVAVAVLADQTGVGGAVGGRSGGEFGGGLDPADLLAREDGLERWRAAIDGAVEALDYQFRQVRRQLESATTLTGRQRIIEAYLRRVAQLGLVWAHPLRRGLVVQRLAALVHMSETAIADLLRRVRPALGRPAEAVASDGGQRLDSPSAAAENNGEADVATDPKRHRLKAVELAERQLIGCVIKQNELFHWRLSDDRCLDEAITPDQMATDRGARLYGRVYKRLGERRPFSLAELLSDLASEGDDSLANLATQADADAERAMQTRGQTIESVLTTSAQHLMAYQREQTYRQTRPTLVSTAQDSDEDAQVFGRVLNQVRDHLNANPSPARIARVRT